MNCQSVAHILALCVRAPDSSCICRLVLRSARNLPEQDGSGTKREKIELENKPLGNYNRNDGRALHINLHNGVELSLSDAPRYNWMSYNELFIRTENLAKGMAALGPLLALRSAQVLPNLSQRADAAVVQASSPNPA